MSTKQTISIGYEIRGMMVDRTPIPWNADSLIITLSLRLPANDSFIPEDFIITLEDGEPAIGNEIQLDSQEGLNSGKVIFRIPLPGKNIKAKVFIKKKLVHEMTIPILAKKKYLDSLVFEQTAITCLFDQVSVACKNYYTAGIRNMSITGLIKSSFGFEPLLGSSVALSLELGNNKKILPWTPSPLMKGETTMPFSMPLGTFPRRQGIMEVSLLVDGNKIGESLFQGLNATEFIQTIQVVKTGFVVWNENNTPQLWDDLDSIKKGHRFGPTFWLRCVVPDCIGLAEGKINGYFHGSSQPMLLWEGKIPLTHLPKLFSPLSMGFQHFSEIKMFELVFGKKSLALVSLSSKPKAQFTNEGTIASQPEAKNELAISTMDLLKKLNSLSNTN